MGLYLVQRTVILRDVNGSDIVSRFIRDIFQNAYSQYCSALKERSSYSGFISKHDNRLLNLNKLSTHISKSFLQIQIDQEPFDVNHVLRQACRFGGYMQRKIQVGRSIDSSTQAKE